jgi:hypothetical protein
MTIGAILTWGDLRAYFPKEAYEKVYQFGHLTMYRNTPENNRRFMADVGQDYKKSFTTSFITVFDELPGMKKKYDLLGIPQYSGHDFADIARRRKNFTLNSEICRKNYKYQIFYYQDGRVFRDYVDKGTMHTDEFNYIHFSKRQMPDIPAEVRRTTLPGLAACPRPAPPRRRLFGNITDRPRCKTCFVP